jgi:hypothetical protein
MSNISEKSKVNIPLATVVALHFSWMIWLSSNIIDIKSQVAKLEGRNESKSAQIPGPVIQTDAVATTLLPAWQGTKPK